jgi:signal transduction histidine kinase
MVHAHHGRIWVESNGERGSAFFIALPRDAEGVKELQRDYQVMLNASRSAS